MDSSERGVILVNVLLFVAIASGIVMLMIRAGDAALDRGLRMREAARAQAILHGGELSAIVALRRDGVVGPASDNLAEPWAALGETAAPIEGGTFSLAIADAQARFNVNMLATGDPAARDTLARIAAALALPPALAAQAAEALRLAGPVADLRPLRQVAIAPETRARLAGLITALPYPTRINANTASEDLLAILLGDPVAAHALVARRARQGYLTPADFSGENMTVPGPIGFTSDAYWVRTRVTIGATTQQRTSLLIRARNADGTVSVRAVARWRGAAAPDQAPPL